MQIISFVFAGFVAVVFTILFAVNKIVQDDKTAVKTANVVLLVASYIFIVYADYRFAVVLATLTIVTWYSAQNKKANKFGILTAVLFLCYFKYTNFFLSSLARIFGTSHSTLNIILPLGISFYTFSAISYIVDVSRGKIVPRNLLDVALYLAYFPKITCGPIQTNHDFMTQIGKKRSVGWDTFASGIQIFVYGLFKKLVLADRLSVFVDQVYATPLAFGSLTISLSAIAYAFQVYYDFSGYSDMAIGVSRLFGIDLPRNFNLPYVAHNVTEMWKRWHITLSNWLQKYVYISLGGNRKGTIRTYINLIITMVVGGFWHGANWTYLTWGFLHGVALAIHKLWMKASGSDRKKHTAISNVLCICLTFLFHSFCCIFFRAESMGQAITIIKRIFTFQKGLEQPYLWLFISIIVTAIASISAYIKAVRKNTPSSNKTNVSIVEGYYPLVDLSSFRGLVVFFVICGILLCLAYTGGSPFIYGKY